MEGHLSNSLLAKVAKVGFVCDFIGLFLRKTDAEEEGSEGSNEVCMVSGYCPGGDLFSWLSNGLPQLGPDREETAKRIMRVVFAAVQEMHNYGFAHGDLSLENVLSTSPPGKEVSDPISLRLIDFGCASGHRARGCRGKPSYQAPEIHNGRTYDAFAADAFSLGVMLFTLVLGYYPWQTTRQATDDEDPCFKVAKEQGMGSYLARRKLRCGEEVRTLTEVLSPELASLLIGLLDTESRCRLSLADALKHPWLN